MATAAYFTAAIPEPFRILGIQLKPLSLGRYRLMKRHDIAYVSEDDVESSAKDLILGVLICSQKVDDFQAWYQTPQFWKEVRKWGNKLAGRFVRKKNIPNLVIKSQMFRAYIRDHSIMPKYWDESGDERLSGAHWSHTVEVTLRSQVGWSREEINEEPLSKALADYFKYAESQGAIRIMTDGESEQGEANGQIFAEMLKGSLN